MTRVSKNAEYEGLDALPKSVAGEDTDSLIFQGANISQLARMSGLDDRTVKERILGKVRPVGSRSGYKVFNIIDAAQYLQKEKTAARLAGVDMKTFCSEFIAQMETASDLPLPVRNAYYQGRLTKLEFEAKQGSLVPLSLVKDVTGAALKAIREQVLLTRDRVEREIQLTKAVKSIITSELDGLIANMQTAILSEFPEPTAMQADGVDDELAAQIDLEENHHLRDAQNEL